MRVIVVGTSAGGVEALKALFSGLPADLDAIVLVVLHIAPTSPGYLPVAFGKAGPLPCVHPKQGQRLEKGHIYLAPPDHHMLVEARGTIRLSRGPKENRSRPAVDPLFRSAALAFGAKVIGVILTGNLDDGTAGLLAVKQSGGTTVVQSPVDAEAPSMPLNAARHVKIDHQVSLSEMAPLLARLTKDRHKAEQRVMPENLKIESQIAADDRAMLRSIERIGDPSIFTCPDCHGTLLRIRDESVLRFRCHTGHAFTAKSMLAALGETTEDTIWSAVRVLQEGALLLEHFAQHARDAGQKDEAKALEQEAQSKLQQAEQIRKSIPHLTEEITAFEG
jgi:two-component system, chemotaxis family, protein-glutamate methylesterase/glutaminase